MGTRVDLSRMAEVAKPHIHSRLKRILAHALQKTQLKLNVAYSKF